MWSKPNLPCPDLCLADPELAHFRLFELLANKPRTKPSWISSLHGAGSGAFISAKPGRALGSAC